MTVRTSSSFIVCITAVTPGESSSTRSAARARRARASCASAAIDRPSQSAPFRGARRSRRLPARSTPSAPSDPTRTRRSARSRQESCCRRCRGTGRRARRDRRPARASISAATRAPAPRLPARGLVVRDLHGHARAPADLDRLAHRVEQLRALVAHVRRVERAAARQLRRERGELVDAARACPARRRGPTRSRRRRHRVPRARSRFMASSSAGLGARFAPPITLARTRAVADQHGRVRARGLALELREVAGVAAPTRGAPRRRGRRAP